MTPRYGVFSPYLSTRQVVGQSRILMVTRNAVSFRWLKRCCRPRTQWHWLAPQDKQSAILLAGNSVGQVKEEVGAGEWDGDVPLIVVQNRIGLVQPDRWFQ